MMSEKKLSIFRPVFSKCNTRWGRWLWKDHSSNSDVRHNGESIYNRVHTLFSFLGFGIAWGYLADDKGNFYIQQEHVMKWDHCEHGCLASQLWIGRMEIYT